ncbi:MAG: DHH family phosphoesterase [Gemmataceae bacterium]
MPIDWQSFAELARRQRRFLLTTHIRPDGDGLGSMLALAEVLQRRAESVQMVVASSIPARYDFLDPHKRIDRFEPPADRWRSCDTVIVLDTGTWNQLGDFGPFMASLPAAKVVIDHHPTQDDLDALRCVDTSAEATGRLVYEAIHALNEPLSAPAAQALFVAVAMDTGWFRFSNTKPATYELAAELTRAGANPESAYQWLFEQNTLPRLRLTGLVLERLQTTCQGQVAYTEVLRDDYAATQALPSDTEDLVNYTRALAGVEVGLFFMEQPRGGVKISLRSRSRVDVGKIAEQLGGGGHRLASGAILDTTLDEARRRVLDAVQAALESCS